MAPKLYLVKLRGLGGYASSGAPMQSSYAVAEDPSSAYDMVRKWLDKKNYGFVRDRALDSVTLMAEDYEFTDSGAMLFLPNVVPTK